MLTLTEYYQYILSNDPGFKLTEEPLPLWFFTQNLQRINWGRAMNTLPFEFLLEHMPKRFWRFYYFKTTEQIKAVGLDKKEEEKLRKNMWFGLFTREEFDSLFSDASEGDRYSLIHNRNIPAEWFVSYLRTFTINEWLHYVRTRVLTREQFELYVRVCDGEAVYNSLIPFDWIPVNEENFETLFSHSQLTMEFVQAHFAQARQYYYHLLEKSEFYDLGVRFILEKGPKTCTYQGYHFLEQKFFEEHPNLVNCTLFCRRDLTEDFIEKHKEKIEDFLDSRPSAKTLAWLRENRPEAALFWLPLLEQKDSFQPFMHESTKSSHDFELHQTREREFRFKMTSAFRSFCS